jgi:hypothetical protein
MEIKLLLVLILQHLRMFGLIVWESIESLLKRWKIYYAKVLKHSSVKASQNFKNYAVNPSQRYFFSEFKLKVIAYCDLHGRLSTMYSTANSH